jgi:hypothetical protein
MKENAGVKIHNHPLNQLLFPNIVFEKFRRAKNLFHVQTQRLPFLVKFKNYPFMDQPLPKKVGEILL